MLKRKIIKLILTIVPGYLYNGLCCHVHVTSHAVIYVQFVFYTLYRFYAAGRQSVDSDIFTTDLHLL